MDLSYQRSRPRSPLGRKERGECFRCGQKGHLVAQCPEPDRRPVQFRQTRTPSPQGSPPPTMTAALPDRQLPTLIRSPQPVPATTIPVNRFQTLRAESPQSLNGVSLY